MYLCRHVDVEVPDSKDLRAGVINFPHLNAIKPAPPHSPPLPRPLRESAQMLARRKDPPDRDLMLPPHMHSKTLPSAPHQPSPLQRPLAVPKRCVRSKLDSGTPLKMLKHVETILISIQEKTHRLPDPQLEQGRLARPGTAVGRTAGKHG